MNRLLANVFAINIARGMARVALSWVMLQRFGAFGLSAVVLSMSVGQFLGSLSAGYLTDRLNRRKVARETSWISGAVFALVEVDFLNRHDGLFPICVLVFIIYILLSVHDNAARTLIPSIVSSGDDIERANGHFITTGEVGSFIGPAITGLLIGFYRAEIVIILAVACCIVAAMAMGGLDPKGDAHRFQCEKREAAAESLTIGFFIANAWLVFGLLLAVLANIFIVPISLVLVPLRINEVGFGAVELGYFYAALSAGFAAAGLLGMRDLWSRLGELRLGAFLAAGSGIYGLTSYFHILPIIVICGLGAGFFLAKFEIGWNSLMQSRIRANMIGRVYGLGSWTSFAGRTIGVSAVGMVASVSSVQITTFGSILCLMLGIAVVTVLTQTRIVQIE